MKNKKTITTSMKGGKANITNGGKVFGKSLCFLILTKHDDVQWKLHEGDFSYRCNRKANSANSEIYWQQNLLLLS